MRGLRQRLAAIAVDITPLRESRDFRFLYAGTAVTQLGTAFTSVAVPFQLYELTGSTLAIGLFGAVTFIPLLFLTVVGGAFADKVERRRWIVGSQLLGLGSAAGLAVNASLASPGVLAIFVLGVGNVCAFALGAPAERASVIRVVGTQNVPSAMALKRRCRAAWPTSRVRRRPACSSPGWVLRGPTPWTPSPSWRPPC